ncbi:MAG TPA: hypothetical protein VJN96_19545 [Vicinamibacterales bacterium]|nr:hypothetical protein [Vicinamibacterales bacterium]
MAGGAPTVRWPRFLLGASLTIAAACTPKIFVPPVGPGEPFPEAAQVWTEATHACRGASTYAAELQVHGKVAQERLNAKIIGLVTRADQISLSVPVMFGSPAFVLGGSADSATLLLPRSERVLTARADEILEALTGLRLGPRALLSVLDGCVAQAETVTASARYGPLGAITTDDGRMFLEQRDGRWRITRGLTAGLIVEYSDIQGDWPRALRITTETGHTPAVSLSITIDQIDVNLPREAKDFVVKVAPNTAPMTLDELRAAGPLREKK